MLLLFLQSKTTSTSGKILTSWGGCLCLAHTIDPGVVSEALASRFLLGTASARVLANKIAKRQDGRAYIMTT